MTANAIDVIATELQQNAAADVAAYLALARTTIDFVCGQNYAIKNPQFLSHITHIMSERAARLEDNPARHEIRPALRIAASSNKPSQQRDR